MSDEIIYKKCDDCACYGWGCPAKSRDEFGYPLDAKGEYINTSFCFEPKIRMVMRDE